MLGDYGNKIKYRAWIDRPRVHRHLFCIARPKPAVMASRNGFFESHYPVMAPAKAFLAGITPVIARKNTILGLITL